jgi:hypothetical protein
MAREWWTLLTVRSRRSRSPRHRGRRHGPPDSRRATRFSLYAPLGAEVPILLRQREGPLANNNPPAWSTIPPASSGAGLKQVDVTAPRPSALAVAAGTLALAIVVDMSLNQADGGGSRTRVRILVGSRV